MSKEEPKPIISRDSSSIILLIVVLVLGGIRLVLPDLLSTSILQPVFAVSSLIASLFYFQRVRSLEQARNTPISDTLVVLGGVYTALLLLLSDINLDLPGLGLAVVFISLGIVGRLILFDSILQSMIHAIEDLGRYLTSWLMSSRLNVLRLFLALMGLFLLTLGEQLAVPYHTIVGTLAIALIFWIDIVRDSTPHTFFRVIGGLTGGVGLVMGLITSLGIQARVGLIIGSISILFWAISRATMTRWVSALRKILPAVKELFAVIFRTVADFITSHKILAIRLGLIVAGIIVLVLANGNSTYILLGILLLASSLADKIYVAVKHIILRLYEMVTTYPRYTGQVISFILAVVSFIFLPAQNSLNYLISGFFFVLAVGPSVFPPALRWSRSFLVSLYESSKLLVSTTIQTLREHTVGSLQVISLVLSLVSYFFLGDTILVGSLSERVAVSLGFLVLGVGPTLFSWTRSALPVIANLFEIFAEWFVRLLKSANTYAFISTVSGIYLLITLPEDQDLYRIAASVLIVAGLAILGDSFIMRVYDRLTHVLIRLSSWVVTIIRFIIPSLSIGIFQTALAWILLIIGVFGIYITGEYSALIRTGLILLSIILWNTAYPHRRARFKSFIQRITGGIVTRLYNFMMWVLRNIFVIGLVIIGLGFIITAAGMIFPGMIQWVVVVFGDILDNRLVSWILGGFFVALGSFTLQQAFVRRSDLQVNQGGRKA